MATEPGGIDIVGYAPAYADAFRLLNEAWISKYFAIEASDRRVLEAPQTEILDQGGDIFVARLDGRPVGVCALLRVDDSTFELAKMAVDPSVQGHGIGSRLGEAAIAEARARGASRMILESNTILAPAMALYRKLGFVEVTGSPSEYCRCNIHMERRLDD
jgi:GNAT superfamily N-acetyltransferase